MGSSNLYFAFLVLILGVRTFAKKEVKAFIDYVSPVYAPFWFIVYDALLESLFWGGVTYMNRISWGPWSTAWIAFGRLVDVAFSCHKGTKNGWTSEDRMNIVGHCLAVILHCPVMFALWRKLQISKRQSRVCTEPEIEKTHQFPQETSEDKAGFVASDFNEKESSSDQALY